MRRDNLCYSTSDRNTVKQANGISNNSPDISADISTDLIAKQYPNGEAKQHTHGDSERGAKRGADLVPHDDSERETYGDPVGSTQSSSEQHAHGDSERGADRHAVIGPDGDAERSAKRSADFSSFCDSFIVSVGFTFICSFFFTFCLSFSSTVFCSVRVANCSSVSSTFLYTYFTAISSSYSRSFVPSDICSDMFRMGIRIFSGVLLDNLQSDRKRM